MLPQQKTENAGYLNPTLVVQAYFMVPVEGDTALRTQFRLREHHDVGRWLLSFLLYLLYKQGQIQEEQRIAEPPGGETREELIRGGVVIVEKRPDGGPAMRLNSNLEMGLYLYARRHGEAALDIALPLGEDPELTYWLIAYCLAEGRIPQQIPLTDNLVASLRRYAVFVDELPAADVYFPDPAAPMDAAAELAPMARVIMQKAGEAVPADVRDVLGPATPQLPPNIDLVWGIDAGTGLAFPLRRSGAAEVPSVVGSRAAERAAQWERQIEEGRETMRRHGYAVLREILAPPQREMFRHYVRELRSHGYFPDLGVGDIQVTLRTNIHKEPTITSLHKGLARLVSRICDQEMLPSFCQLGIYEAGAVLEKHKDRSQCIRNLSFIFDMWSPQGEPDPWPFYLEVDGKPKEVLLNAGDGAIYPGTRMNHWRDALPAGQRAIAAFFFFVTPDYKGTLN